MDIFRNTPPLFSRPAQAWSEGKAYISGRRKAGKADKRMPDSNKPRHYRIGTYAQNMGVTPDLLKHYEKMGLLHAQTSENGYRYYPFSESVSLLECFSLRNYQMPLQQMHETVDRIMDFVNKSSNQKEALN